MKYCIMIANLNVCEISKNMLKRSRSKFDFKILPMHEREKKSKREKLYKYRPRDFREIK